VRALDEHTRINLDMNRHRIRDWCIVYLVRNFSGQTNQIQREETRTAMNTQNTLVTTALLLTAASTALADITPEDPSILSPFDNAEVSVFWTGSDAAYNGKLFLVDLLSDSDSVLLWDNHSALENQSFKADRLYKEGDRVDFTYVISGQGRDSFSTFVESDWQQFSIDSSNPLEVIVSLEDIRKPNGDADHNDAVFRVVFTPATVPAPGALALLSSGALLAGRRRR
jgi:hypothetical protein